MQIVFGSNRFLNGCAYALCPYLFRVGEPTCYPLTVFVYLFKSFAIFYRSISVNTTFPMWNLSDAAKTIETQNTQPHKRHRVRHSMQPSVLGVVSEIKATRCAIIRRARYATISSSLLFFFVVSCRLLSFAVRCRSVVVYFARYAISMAPRAAAILRGTMSVQNATSAIGGD